MRHAIEINTAMIKRYIEYVKAEFNEDITAEKAQAELENLKAQGCLLYEDCRSCPLFGKDCPI